EPRRRFLRKPPKGLSGASMPRFVRLPIVCGQLPTSLVSPAWHGDRLVTLAAIARPVPLHARWGLARRSIPGRGGGETARRSRPGQPPRRKAGTARALPATAAARRPRRHPRPLG